jgi:hypothetical protein
MGASAKLERLKYSWVAYAAIVSIVDMFRHGFDRESFVGAGLHVGVTYVLAWYVMRQLNRKSSLVWAFGVVIGCLGAIGAFLEIIRAIVDPDDLGFELDTFLLACAGAYIHVTTFRVLRDPEVKRHVMLD